MVFSRNPEAGEGELVAISPDAYTEVPPKETEMLSSLRAEFASLIQAVNELKLPQRQAQIYQDRIAELTQWIYGLEHDLEFYQIPQNYYIGGVEQFVGGLRFNGLIPPEIMAKYLTVEGVKIFDLIVVASPDFAKFQSAPVPPVYQYKDPVMVALSFKPKTVWTLWQSLLTDKLYWQNPQNKTTPGFYYGGDMLTRLGYTGFLIAHWDLDKDLQLAPVS